LDECIKVYDFEQDADVEEVCWIDSLAFILLFIKGLAFLGKQETYGLRLLADSALSRADLAKSFAHQPLVESCFHGLDGFSGRADYTVCDASQRSMAEHGKLDLNALRSTAILHS
jgi:hypothetical protein